jgi:hypothetical protein
MIRCAIVDTATGFVVNVIEYETVPEGTPPGLEDGMIAVAGDTASPGDIYDAENGTFKSANPMPMGAPQHSWGPTLFNLLGGKDYVGA